MQVERRDGILQPATLEPAADTGLDWMTYIRPARDRHEQNVEVVLDHRGDGGGGLRLRTSRAVRAGDELLVWYGDQLALDLGVPLLTPANMTGILALVVSLYRPIAFQFGGVVYLSSSTVCRHGKPVAGYSGQISLRGCKAVSTNRV